MIQFRTGPHMGIPYQEARALGLSSALKGPEFYEQYVSTVKVTTPSERLLMDLDFSGLEERMHRAYKANRQRPTVTLSGLLPGLFPATQLPDHWGQGDYIVGLLKACAESFKAPKEWTQPVPFDVLKPARKEKPE